MPSPHLLLRSAVTDVCNHASLSGRGDARAKSISLHAGIFHRAAETSSASSSSIPKPNSDIPRMLCFPRADDKAKRLSLYTGFFHRETGLRQAAAARRTFLGECCAFAEALA